VDEIDELIEMAADARKRLADAQRDYDEIKRRIGKRADEAKQAKTAEVERPVSVREANHLLAEMLPVKAPVVDGVVDYDAAKRNSEHRWHLRYTLAMQNIARQILAMSHRKGPDVEWKRRDEFRALNDRLVVSNNIPGGRMGVRLAAVIALFAANGAEQQHVAERWRTLANLQHVDDAKKAETTMQALVLMCHAEQFRGTRRNNVSFFLMAWAAMRGLGPYMSHEDMPSDVKQQAFDWVRAFWMWMTGDQ
jgi:hypothetical protein